VSVVISPADPREQPASGLLADMVAEVSALHGPKADRRGFHVAPGELMPPTGAFLVVVEDGRPVGCGGLKRWAPGTGEIKRMYIAPPARSRGHARRLLAALEEAARGLGYVRVRLDTGPRQPHALELYRSSGYRPIPDYNGNRRAAHWFEKDL
jgi:GNAT superfamily N-acetyltransferase